MTFDLMLHRCSVMPISEPLDLEVRECFRKILKEQKTNLEEKEIEELERLAVRTLGCQFIEYKKFRALKVATFEQYKDYMLSREIKIHDKHDAVVHNLLEQLQYDEKNVKQKKILLKLEKVWLFHFSNVFNKKGEEVRKLSKDKLIHPFLFESETYHISISSTAMKEAFKRKLGLVE